MSEIVIKRCTNCGHIGRFTPDFIKCNKCEQETLQVTKMTTEEFSILCDVAPKNNELRNLMIDLKEKDPIEYQLKISQFKTQVQQQESIKKQQSEQSKVHCPYCNSTNVKKISGTERVAGAVAFGLFSKTARSQFKCENCGYMW